MPEGEHFIKSIETDVELPERGNYYDEMSVEDIEGSYFAIEITTNKETYYAWVYNVHNGYYSHAIYYTEDVTDPLRIDY